MAQSNTHIRKIQPTILRYGLALLSVVMALESALFIAEHNLEGVELPLFLFAIALTAWYGGTGPAILALVLSSLAFDYFTAPLHSLRVRRSELPHYVTYIVCGAYLNSCGRLH